MGHDPSVFEEVVDKPYFLSRPHRFGKSLLLFTPEAYFLGKCGLFRGLAMETLETEWAEHAILHLDLNMEAMARRYDGYRFSSYRSESMYNPFCVLSALSKRSFDNYWFATGTPTFLVEILKKTDFDLRELDGIQVTAASLSDDGADIRNPIPMIYQSGYLTIKDYDEEFQGIYARFPERGGEIWLFILGKCFDQGVIGLLPLGLSVHKVGDDSVLLGGMTPSEYRDFIDA